MSPETAIITARQAFPRGLEQPEGSLRFGMDALLLAAFAARQCLELFPTSCSGRLRPAGSRPGPATGSHGTDLTEPQSCQPACTHCQVQPPQHQTADPPSGPEAEATADSPTGCTADFRSPCSADITAPEPAMAALAAHSHNSIAELGSGCGAALLGVLLRVAGLRGLGLELDAALVAAARRNAALLQLDAHFHQADLADLRSLQPLQNSLPLVLANPPYGLAGRPSPQSRREQALRRSDALTVFCRAGAFLLRHGGHFCCIFPAARLTALCAALEKQHLGLRRLLPLQAHSHEPASRLLVLARKNARSDLKLLPPLVLHKAQPQSSKPPSSGQNWTEEAVAFCPFLGDNDAGNFM